MPIGWLLGLFSWIKPLVARLALGAIVGALFGLVLHAASGERSDFASVRVTVPVRYEIVADPEVADEAARMIHEWHLARALAEAPFRICGGAPPAPAHWARRGAGLVTREHGTAGRPRRFRGYATGRPSTDNHGENGTDNAVGHGNATT